MAAPRNPVGPHEVIRERAWSALWAVLLSEPADPPPAAPAPSPTDDAEATDEAAA